jgi:hypothetical protein
VKRVAPLVLLAGCAGTPAPSDEVLALPESLHDLALVQAVSGTEAQNLIAHLHPGPLAPAESQVGFYASGENHAVLYVSRFPERPLAQAQLDAMSAAIGRGRGGFGHHTETEIGRTVVHSAVGQGRMHFFFTRDREVLWLVADAEPAREALAELLRLPLDSLPPE